LFARAGQVLVVDEALAGIRLLDLLARERPGAARMHRELLAAGDVRLNGAACLHDRRLRAGDVVEVGPPAIAAAPGPRLRGARTLPAVRFESASALVVAKPAGVPTVPDRSGNDRGLHGMLEALRPGADLRIVHRLDRDTSGCLLLGKGLAAARHFDTQFAEGLVEKTYVAVVHGVPGRPEFTIDAWLGPDRRRPGKVVASATEQPGFRAAQTFVRVRQAFAAHALLELQPATGRGHQLRVHLQSIGHPIAGDRDYGGESLLLSRLKPGYKLRVGVDERPLAPRLFLHAERLAFRDLDGTAVEVTTPLPDDLAPALRQLHNHDEARRRPCD
jgi:23S rRNA pseudouridine955/2504/2580 synthase